METSSSGVAGHGGEGEGGEEVGEAGALGAVVYIRQYFAALGDGTVQVQVQGA